MKTLTHRIGLALACAALAAAPLRAAEIELYVTGPAEDSSFLRFVNGAGEALQVQAEGSQARLTLDAEQPASDFMAVRANAPIRGTLARGSQRSPLALEVLPGQFATVIGMGDPLKAEVVREEPDDFNALKASLGFYAMDAACQAPALLAVPRNVAIFENVADRSVQRRQINPIALSVQLRCGDQPAGSPLDLGTLQAGERYTVFLVPGAQGPRIFSAVDSLAR